MVSLLLELGVSAEVGHGAFKHGVTHDPGWLALFDGGPARKESPRAVKGAFAKEVGKLRVFLAVFGDVAGGGAFDDGLVLIPVQEGKGGQLLEEGDVEEVNGVAEDVSQVHEVKRECPGTGRVLVNGLCGPDLDKEVVAPVSANLDRRGLGPLLHACLQTEGVVLVVVRKVPCVGRALQIPLDKRAGVGGGIYAIDTDVPCFGSVGGMGAPFRHGKMVAHVCCAKKNIMRRWAPTVRVAWRVGGVRAPFLRGARASVS